MIGVIIGVMSRKVAEIKADYYQFKKANPNGCFVCRDTKEVNVIKTKEIRGTFLGLFDKDINYEVTKPCRACQDRLEESR